MGKITDPVELRQAFAFYCHECGEENFFCCSVPPMLSPDELDSIASALGQDPDDKYIITEIPERVQCGRCGSEFSTITEFHT